MEEFYFISNPVKTNLYYKRQSGGLLQGMKCHAVQSYLAHNLVRFLYGYVKFIELYA